MERIAILGLGYAGMPVAASFIEAGYQVLGYDSDQTRVLELKGGVDRTDNFSKAELFYMEKYLTDNASDLSNRDIFIVLVQTGLTDDLNPDVSAVESAARVVSSHIKAGNLIILSSTVPIGFTEGVFQVILEKYSGLKAGIDFGLAFAPERIDPGNQIYTVKTITKIISAIDDDSLSRTRALYEPVVNAIVQAPSIKAAEASRLIENTQRDVNIAFLNDVSLILNAWGIDTNDVLSVARTKWNFLPFRPGLVGGHCVNVHTHYLRQAAGHVGLTPSLTTLIRQTNDDVPERVSHACAQALMRRETQLPAVVTILGVSYKEDVPDTRGSAVFQVAQELEKYGCKVQLTDPFARYQDVLDLHGRELILENYLEPADAIVLAVPHRVYVDLSWSLPVRLLKPNAGVVLDIHGTLPRETKPQNVTLWRL